ncbi:MAG TPA: diguanylate cyclase [Vicinamibacterales bacterium]
MELKWSAVASWVQTVRRAWLSSGRGVGRSLLFAPAVLYPLAIAATVAGVLLVEHGRSILGAAAVGLAAAVWHRGHRLGCLQAESARRDRRLSDLHLATIEALALAIDAKDKTSGSHIRRVQAYSRALAQAVGMGADNIQGLTTAALLHDIGKLAVPEHILSKPGRLTDEEFQKIQIHPQVGFEIVEHVPFPYPVAPLVLCHHERWDGKGYPLGLKAEDIPLGARILAVADYFDSLTRDRPYNKRMPRDLAMLKLRQEAGKALDPQIVSAFLDLLPSLPAVEDAMVPSMHIEVDARAAVSTSRRLLEHGEKSAFENIARAHQEIYALYDIAQAIGSCLGVADTMALVANKLSALVPFSCCALFVRDEDDIIRCKFASGVDADDISRITLHPGRGLAGWVARNRRALVNARPAADFEAGDVPPAAPRLQSALVCPLIFNDHVIGTLSVYHTDANFYNDEHRRLLDRISQQTAAAISNSIVFETTREASLSDPLTGLPNTRFMFTHLGRELSRARRLSTQVSILVLDLDDFKEINDTYGHHIGDRALREVARVLRETIRPYDLCVRYAGDEFIVVLSDCGPEESEAKRVELQQAIDAVVFESSPGRAVNLSVSIGAAVFPTDGETYEALLATADGRMYRDKKNRKQGITPVRSRRVDPVTLADEVERQALAHALPTARIN